MRPNPCLKESLHAGRALPTFSAINSQIPPNLARYKATERFFLVVQTLAVALRDNSGTDILSFPLLLKLASARAAIPRTSNPLQVCNSWVHRNERIAFP
jgi:hypothetical protein